MLKWVEYKIANFLEFLRQYSPNWVRRWILPRWFKDLLQDVQWCLYRQNSTSLNGQVKPLKRPVLLITIPKCGTHLLRSVLLLLPQTRWRGVLLGIDQVPGRSERLSMCQKRLENARPAHVYTGHVPYDPELAAWLDEQKISKIFVYRDPRDYAVSLYHFIMNTKPRLPLYERLAALGSNASRLMACIRGIGENAAWSGISANSLPNVQLYYQQFLGWLDDPNSFAIQFEDLIGDGSNGLSPLAAKTVQAMLEHLRILKEPLSSSFLEEFIHSAMDPSKSPTFRMGKTGTWRDEFNSEHIQAFKELGGKLLIQLGYERDLEWG